MEAKDVLKLPWVRVDDWSDLHVNSTNDVSRSDIDIFIENLYRDIARKLQIQYQELEPILEEENSAFEELRKRLYDRREKISENSISLKKLKRLLRVPDVKCVDKKCVDNLSECLRLFEELSEIEKVMFLQKIGKITVKVQCATEPTV